MEANRSSKKDTLEITSKYRVLYYSKGVISTKGGHKKIPFHYERDLPRKN